MLTDRTIVYNRPDILLVDLNTGSGILIDIAVPLTHNIKKIESEKRIEYEELAWQIKDIWKLERVSIYPLVISVEGVVLYNFNKNIEKLGLPNTILKHAQKATLLQTCHIMRKFLNNWRLYGGSCGPEPNPNKDLEGIGESFPAQAEKVQ